MSVAGIAPHGTYPRATGLQWTTEILRWPKGADGILFVPIHFAGPDGRQQTTWKLEASAFGHWLKAPPAIERTFGGWPHKGTAVPEACWWVRAVTYDPDGAVGLRDLQSHTQRWRRWGAGIDGRADLTAIDAIPQRGFVGVPVTWLLRRVRAEQREAGRRWGWRCTPSGPTTLLPVGVYAEWELRATYETARHRTRAYRTAQVFRILLPAAHATTLAAQGFMAPHTEFMNDGDGIEIAVRDVTLHAEGQPAQRITRWKTWGAGGAFGWRAAPGGLTVSDGAGAAPGTVFTTI